MRLIVGFILTAMLIFQAEADPLQSLHFYTEEYPPFSYRTDEGVGGINVELLKR